MALIFRLGIYLIKNLVRRDFRRISREPTLPPRFLTSSLVSEMRIFVNDVGNESIRWHLFHESPRYVPEKGKLIIPLFGIMILIAEMSITS